MKIGFDAKRLFLNTTGLGSYSRNLLSALQLYYPNHEYFLFTPEFRKNIQKEFNYTAFKVIEPSGFFSKNFKSLWRRKTIGRLAAQEKLDIYHGLSHELPINIQKQGVKSVVTIHDLIFLRYPKWYPAVDRRFYERKIKHAIKVADKLICISPQTKADLIELMGADEKKICVIPPSVHPVFYNEPEWHVRNYLVNTYNLQSRFILSVSSFTERKNQLSLLKAFKELLKKMPDVEMVMIGDGKEYRNQALRYLQENDLLNKVQMIDYCSNERLAAFYRLASVFVYPSLYEGFGMPITEAMFSRVPVITSRVPGFTEAGGPGSVYVDPLNTGEMADAIMDCLDNPRESIRRVDENHRYVQRFRDKAVAEELIKTYQSI